MRTKPPMSLPAKRAFITRTTLTRVEKGDPTVALGTYGTVLFILGLSNRLAELADISHDEVGQQLQDEQLPKRIRASKPKTGAA